MSLYSGTHRYRITLKTVRVHPLTKTIFRADFLPHKENGGLGGKISSGVTFHIVSEKKKKKKNPPNSRQLKKTTTIFHPSPPPVIELNRAHSHRTTTMECLRCTKILLAQWGGKHANIITQTINQSIKPSTNQQTNRPTEQSTNQLRRISLL